MGSVKEFLRTSMHNYFTNKNVMESHLLEYCGSYYGSNHEGLEAMFQASISAFSFWMMKTMVMNGTFTTS
jgi:hypothetical protein